MTDRPSAPASFRERRFLTRDGLSLYARDYAPRTTARPGMLDGVIVVCLAGLTRNSKDFEDLATRLSDTRRVLCPDYRGRGQSAYDPDWRNYRPETYLDDLLQLLTALDIDRVIAVGTSLGGLLAQGLAVARPGLLAGIVINDIGPEIGVVGVGRILDYISVDRPQPDWASATAEIKQIFGYLELGSDANWQRMAHATFRGGSDGMLHFDWDVRLAKPMRANLSRTPDLWPYFHAIRRIPALALRGGRSEVLSAETLTRMAEANPDLRTATVPSVGHAPHLGEPEAIAALDDLLQHVDRRETAT